MERSVKLNDELTQSLTNLEKALDLASSLQDTRLLNIQSSNRCISQMVRRLGES